MENPKNPEAEPTQSTEMKKKACATCSNQSGELSRCSRCKMVYYCNIDCQKKHFPEHKQVCKQELPQTTKSLPDKDRPQEKVTQKKEKQKTGIDEFKDLKFVGRGNFSQIYSGVSYKDGKTYAIKQIDKSKLKRMEKEADVFMEKHCLQKIKNWDYGVQIQKTFQDQLSLYIQMEFPERGQLWEQCRTYGCISNELVRYYFCHLVKAVYQLHTNYDIVHRDLKPENILLTKDFKLKLIDFGTAKDTSRPDLKGSGNGSRRRKVFEHYVGTPNYMAPECIRNKASEKVSDVFSLAGNLYFLKTGNPPFTGGSEYLIFNKSLEQLVYLPEDIFSKQEQDLILQMMDKDWSSRIDMGAVLKHRYFEGVDWQKLPTYQQTLSRINQSDRKLIQIKSQLLKYSDKVDTPIQQRILLYKNTLKPMIDNIFNQLPHEITEEIKRKVHLMKIATHNMLNLSEDTNKGFEQLHKQYSKQSDI